MSHVKMSVLGSIDGVFTAFAKADSLTIYFPSFKVRVPSLYFICSFLNR
ncbi:hypothetical protein [uncultured Nonlabens sp.]|nr:hypothetical protein [uncultured Nonlabens sp.]